MVNCPCINCTLKLIAMKRNQKINHTENEEKTSCVINFPHH